MKVNFNRAALSEALGLLTSVVPSRTPKPILRCVQITAEEKEVRYVQRTWRSALTIWSLKCRLKRQVRLSCLQTGWRRLCVKALTMSCF